MASAEMKASSFCKCETSVQPRRSTLQLATSRLCRPKSYLSRRCPASKRESGLLQGNLHRRSCASAAAAATGTSQTRQAADEQKQAMQAAMAKAKAGRVSEGGWTCMQPVKFRRSSQCCVKASTATAGLLQRYQGVFAASLPRG